MSEFRTLEWVKGKPVVRDMTAEEIATFRAVDLTAARQSASLSKRQFCLAMYRAGILKERDAIAAAKGEWPAAMAGFLGYLTPDQATDAQIEWGGATVIERTNPIVLTLASWLSLPDEQVDKIFGIAG